MYTSLKIVDAHFKGYLICCITYMEKKCIDINMIYSVNYHALIDTRVTGIMVFLGHSSA